MKRYCMLDGIGDGTVCALMQTQPDGSFFVVASGQSKYVWRMYYMLIMGE